MALFCGWCFRGCGALGSWADCHLTSYAGGDGGSGAGVGALRLTTRMASF